MNRIRGIINKYSSGKRVLLLFILTNLVYAFMLTITIPKTTAFSDGMKLPDMMPGGYDQEYINTLFQTLGEKGRAVYLYNQIPVDMIYPFLFGISYCLLMAYFLKKIDKLNSPFFYLCFLPVIAGIADYSENFGIISTLIKYPGLSHKIIITANVFTVTKSIMVTVSFTVLLMILLILGIKTIKQKTSTKSLRYNQ